MRNIRDSALEAARARHKYKLRAEAAGKMVSWKTSGEADDNIAEEVSDEEQLDDGDDDDDDDAEEVNDDDGGDAEEAIDAEQLERSSASASGYAGVYAQGNRWQAKWEIGGKVQYIGSFAR